VVYVSADLEALDRRLREEEVLSEVQLQEHLADAAGQRARAAELWDQQHARARQEAADAEPAASGSAAAPAAAAAAAMTGAAGGSGSATAGRVLPQLQVGAQRLGPGAGFPSLPGTPNGKARGASTASVSPHKAAAAADVAAAASAAAAGAAASPAAAEMSKQTNKAAEPAAVVDALLDNTGHIDTCYSHLKHALSACWPVVVAHTPGLLLLQRHPESPPPGALAASLLAGGGVLQAPPDAATVLRLRAVTAASALLQLPRGRHALRLVCSDLLLHTASFTCSAAAEFQVAEEGAKAGAPVGSLPAAGAVTAGQPPATQHGVGQHQAESSGVLQQEGEHETVCAGSQQLLFRFLLQASEHCTIGVRLACSSAALAAAARLMVIDNATGSATYGLINRIEGLQVGVSVMH
jgi:hypothetical protein